MRFEHRSFTSEDPRQDVLQTGFLFEQICLAVVLQIAVINLFSQVVKPLDFLLPAWLLHMRTGSAAAALAASLSFFCIESNRPRWIQHWGRIFAGFTAAIGAAGILAFAGQTAAIGHFSAFKRIFGTENVFPASALAFLVMGIVILFIRSRGVVLGRVADAAASCLAFLMLLLVSELGFGTAGLERSSIVGNVSIPTLGCLALLTVAIVIRRAEHGIFSAFLGGGIGGRIARMLAPILIVLPFLRELGRARLLQAQLVPASYSTALLASVATAVSIVLLIVLTRIINRMQRDIQDLTLRDELTGLYNFRGFNLFAEQAFRLARRARIPFGVLFIDMDNLKIINDELGHNAGSAYIVETAKLLNETFRETDVIGRLGGDEFVVAGQFEDDEIESIIGRLRSGAAARKASPKGHPLSFSMGFASTGQTPADTLKSVVARADHAMYREKREKKRMVLA
ncbi:MAG TPA: GGDEF domain-containing protein [Terracidiphilus sp.]|jgi:diguanylate cyclase (GGDEF)-like protein